MKTYSNKLQEATDFVREAWYAADSEHDQAPTVVITTGSGLGAVVEEVSPVLFEISYDDIPHLPSSRIVGHAGRLLIGLWDNRKVVVLDGRIHGYEGHDPLTQVLPLLIANELCDTARLMIFTNAAGAINEFYQAGQIMLIADHINLTGESLVQLNEEASFGGGNLDMTFAYTPAYRRVLEEIARQNDIRLYQGVYIGVKGAMFETPAEIKAFRKWGADAVGMSTVHEVTAASHLGIDVVGLSVLTNMAAGIEDKRLTHEEVLETTTLAMDNVRVLITDLLDTLS